MVKFVTHAWFSQAHLESLWGSVGWEQHHHKATLSAQLFEVVPIESLYTDVNM